MSREFNRMPQAFPSGGWLVDDQQAIKDQRAVVWDLVKQLGQSITNGGTITKISIPVKVAEPRSYLERITDGWCYAPHFLTKAANCDDALERMKLVITFAIAGLHNTATIPKKPFNPILGETWEAEMSDGTKLYLEQASHHPPVSNWSMVGPDDAYHFYGSGEWSASFRGNSVKGQQLGDHFVEFNDGTIISYTLGEVWARGIMYGDRVCEYLGTMEFKDEKNNLFGSFKFSPEVSSWFGWSKKKLPSDYFVGGIYEGQAVDESKKLCALEGSWLACVEFDGIEYWNFEQELEKYEAKKVAEPLPSDCRYREDIIYLNAEDMESAEECVSCQFCFCQRAFFFFLSSSGWVGGYL
eukprot:TRINITY_DN11002_c0_g2_i4.p1 TRINITY_DN11002_c0_g2~~TRINITY_DN11002_c0_g2_i4.p1  ORF type:complete len:354 (+),score=95.46 TRINITY_DN11002_c0_g2_i4:30-1091(+)